MLAGAGDCADPGPTLLWVGVRCWMWSCWGAGALLSHWYPTPTGVIPVATLFGYVRLEILTGTREMKPRCLQDQTHHGHTVGSLSVLAEEEEEEEREVTPLCRTLSLCQQPTRGRASGTQHTGQMG